MTDEEWIKAYKPIPHDGISEGLESGYDCGNGPCLWETYGADAEEVNRRRDLPEWRARLWTVHDDTSISEGYHFINRVGYIFTERPAEKNAVYQICDPDFGAATSYYL